MTKGAGLAALPERDRALVRHLVGSTLRRLGTLRHVLGLYLDRGFPADAPRVETALLLGAAQILLLQTPDHAAVDMSVRLVAGRPAREALCAAWSMRCCAGSPATARSNWPAPIPRCSIRLTG